MNRYRVIMTVALAVAAQFGTPGTARAQSVPDDSQKRIDALLHQLTTTQKLALMHGGDPGPFAGRVPGVPELGIPPLSLDDGPAGIRGASSFALPAPIALAATWNADRAGEFGAVLGRDALAAGANGVLGPVLDVARVYANGRTFEGFGEEPWLASELTVPEIRAIQRLHVVAVAKHFVAYTQQNGQHRDSVIVDGRTLREVYVAPFAAAVRDGRVGGVMCSYNRIGDSWSCENPLTLGILKRDIGFSGFVVSDWYAQHDVFLSLANGLDLEMPRGLIYGDYLTGAVARGNASIRTVDEHVGRILRGMMLGGLFDRDSPATPSPADRSADMDAGRRVADEGAVLLKNDNETLPLERSKVRSLAVIGPLSRSAVVAGGGSSFVRYDTGSAPSIIDAFRNAAAGIDVRVAQVGGPPFLEDAPTLDTLALTPPSGSGTGLLGSYYANPDLAGAPAMTRIDRYVWFQWGTTPPAPMLPIDSSARWTGTLRVPATGSYRIGGDGRCFCRLRIGDAVVQDSWNLARGASSTLGTIALQAGVPYQIVFEWHFGGDGNVRLAWVPPPRSTRPDIANAVAVARQADAAVVFVGDFSTEERDRTTLRLTGDQEALIEAVAAVNAHTAVVLETGGPVVMSPWIDRTAAALELWYPGEAGGLAAADLIFGSVNPSGKLPVSFPIDDEHVPAKVLWDPEPVEGPARPIAFTERLDVGYRWYDAQGQAPLYPFGFGLSYTQFAYANLATTREADGTFDVAADVTNTGARSGDAVLEVYLAFPQNAGEPPHLLRGARKVHLQPGETARVSITLPIDAFKLWDERAHDWRLAPGRYVLFAGSSSRDLPLSTPVEPT